MITEIQGDLFSTSSEIIVHGCNCQGKMGSGVAKIVRDNYPNTYQAYMKQASRKSGLKLGSIITCYENNKFMVNAMTQEYYGYDGALYTSYDAIRSCLSEVHTVIYNSTPWPEWSETKIAMPKIGCGLGGGDWDVVKKIIEEQLDEFDVEVYYL